MYAGGGHFGSGIVLPYAYIPAPRLGIPMDVEHIQQPAAGLLFGLPHLLQVATEEIAAPGVGGILKVNHPLPAIVYRPENRGSGCDGFDCRGIFDSSAR